MIEEYIVTYVEKGQEKTWSLKTTSFIQAERAAEACLMKWVKIENDSKLLHRRVKDNSGRVFNRVFMQKINT